MNSVFFFMTLVSVSLSLKKEKMLKEAPECMPGPPCLTISLGRLNSERSPLIWPRAILSSGLSPSRIPVKKLERNTSTLCRQHHSQPTKHTHLLTEIQAQRVEDPGHAAESPVVSVSFSFCLSFCKSGPLLPVSDQDPLPSVIRRLSSLAIREMGVKNSLSSLALKTVIKLQIL